MQANFPDSSFTLSEILEQKTEQAKPTIQNITGNNISEQDLGLNTDLTQGDFEC